MTDPTSISQSSFGEGSQNIALNPGVAIAKVEQLIQHFHISPQKIRTLDRFWKSWSQDTKPPFSPDLVIGGREKNRDRAIDWLRGSPDVLTLQGESQKEVSAFLAAVVQGLEPEERANILDRAVVIDCETSWQHLIESTDPMILIVELGEPEGIGTAIKNGHHVFVPSDRVSSDRANLLPRIVRSAAEKALHGMGLNRNKVHRYATLARRSLSALRRELAIAKNIQQPAWAKPNEAQALLAPLLISTWNDSCNGDRKVLEQLSGKSYKAIQTLLVRWVNEPDAPIRKVGDIWTIASQEDAWILIARYFTDDDLKRFEDVAIDVLSELDPAFELPSKQRLMADVYGKVLSRSNSLRNGILEMLALMATLSSNISLSTNRSGEDVASRIVLRLMEQAKANPLLWASLASKLPLLAEAAPEILLDAIEKGLSGENPILVSLFQEKTSLLALSSPHTGLLWALETLALNPDCLTRAALLLARLTRLDPGGNLGNRPVDSLNHIFALWMYFHPKPNSHLQEQLQLIDIIHKSEPDIAWNLLMSLLPYSHLSWTERKTRWRDWAPNTYKTTIDRECIDTNDSILWKSISKAGIKASRWCNLIAARYLNSNQKDLLITALELLQPCEFSLEDRAIIFDCLHDAIFHYRKNMGISSLQNLIPYPSIQHPPISIIERFESISARFKPQDPIYHYCWLFQDYIELPGNHDISLEEENRIVDGLRLEVLQEILNSQGWNGVLQLAQQVQEPSVVGVALAEAQLLPIDLNLFLKDNFGSFELWRHKLARSYVGSNAYNQGERWIDSCVQDNLQSWSAEEYGKFLLCLPFNLCLLERLDKANLETQSYFWSHVERVEFIGVERTDWVLTKLLEVGRPHLAVTRISWVLRNNPELFSPKRIAEVLKASVRTKPGQDYNPALFSYQSAKLMNYLEKTDLSRDRLANLEWAYFHIHNQYRRPRILFENLANKPDFFVGIIQYISCPENKLATEDSDKKDESNPDVAKLIWYLLEEWKQLPGVSRDLPLNTVPLIWLLLREINPIVGILLLNKFLEIGSVDTEALKSWVLRVRELAAKCDRINITDRYVGCALAFSLIDPDGAWPHKVVRDLIELANPVINDSWQTQIFNNRGITFRSLTDGGKQERILAEKYMKDAKQIGNQWPQTAAILRKIANEYSQEASREDVSAELIQDFW